MWCAIILVILMICIQRVWPFEAKLTVSLKNSGFHRELRYVTVFPDTDIQFDYYLEQLLPASVFVSNDELSDLTRFHMISYHIQDNIDIEKPTEKSDAFRIYLYGRGSSMHHINLPLHFRYHAPGNSSFVKVNIDYPRLFVAAETVAVGSAHNSTGLAASHFKCKDSAQLCDWREVAYDNYSRKPIAAHIPIGNAHMSGIVTIVTIALSWAACVYLARALHQKYCNLNKKLNYKAKTN